MAKRIWRLGRFPKKLARQTLHVILKESTLAIFRLTLKTKFERPKFKATVFDIKFKTREIVKKEFSYVN